MERHVLIGLAACYCFFLSWAAAETYTFTSTTGDQLEAELIGVANGEVEIRRVSDGRIFNLPMSRLIVDDHIYIKSWQEDQISPAKRWKRVRVTMANSARELRVIGVPHAIQRVGANEWEAWLSEGVWVEIERPLEIGAKLMVDYRGGAEWRLRFEDDILFGVSEGGEEQVWGFEPKVVEQEFEEQRSLMRRTGARDGVAVTLGGDTQLDRVKRMSLKISSAMCLSSRTVNRLHELNPKAVSGLWVESSETDDIQKLQDLDALILRTNNDQTAYFMNNLSKYGNLRNLRTLETWDSNPYSLDLLSPLSNLEYYYFDFYSVPPDFTMTSAPVPLEALPKLTSVGGIVEPGNMAGEDRITTLSPFEGRHQNAAFLSRYPSLVLATAVPLMEQAGSEFNEELQASCRHLRYLSSSYKPDLSGMARLRHLRLYSTKQTEWFSNPDLYADGELQTLSIDHVKQEDLTALASLPAFQNLQALHISYEPNLDDFSVLAQLPKLRVLSLSGPSGGALISLDLATLPALEYLKTTRCRVAEISNALTHPKLVHLELTGTSIKGFGQAVPNQQLKTLILDNITTLESLEAFHETTGLKVLHIEDTKDTKEADLLLDTINELDYLRLSDTNLNRSR